MPEEVSSHEYFDQRKALEDEAGDLIEALQGGKITKDEFRRIYADKLLAQKQKELTLRRQKEQYKTESGQAILLERLLNRRRFEEEFQRTLALADRQNSDYCLLFIDVDNMKGMNDTYGGHERTDEFLKELEEAFIQSTRRSDLKTRWAGDELAIALPDTPPVGAITVAHNVGLAYAELQIDKGLIRLPETNAGFVPGLVYEGNDKFFNFQQTVSIGIVNRSKAIGPGELYKNTDPSALIGMADKMMYEAKKAGKKSRQVHPTPRALSSIAIFKGFDEHGIPQTEIVDANKIHEYKNEDFPGI